MKDAIKNKVRTFIIENFLFSDASLAPLDGDSLLENEIIDSTGILELVGFLEEQFAISVSDAQMVPRNLDSLDRIADFVTSQIVDSAEAAE